MLDAQEDFQHAKALVRMQMASISALKVRIDVGRSLLSNEKAQASLIYSGVDLWRNANVPYVTVSLPGSPRLTAIWAG